MRTSASFRQTALFAASIFVPLVSQSQDQKLSIKPGFYVQESSQCNAAPNAAILSWDGTAFSGAHASKCSSTIVHRGANNFVVSTSCSALGDGSPNPSAKAFAETFVLSELSDSRLTVTKRNQTPATYRWCSVKPPQ